MITVNIPVTGPDSKWIVGRLARELKSRLPAYGFEVTLNGREPADIEYHSNVYGPPQETGRVSAGLFAHDDGRPRQFAPMFDAHVVLNPDMANLICALLLGTRPLERLTVRVIEQAVDEIFLHEARPKFGVAGSVKPGNPRKGEALVTKMLEHGFDVRAWGTGWPCPIVSDDYQLLPDFYRSLDYYVVTSTLEGGCTPIIECMAMNVPVISPRIGFAIPRPVIEYQGGNWDSLHGVLRYLTTHRTYDDWAADHAKLFRELVTWK